MYCQRAMTCCSISTAMERTGWAAINPVNNVGAVNYVWSDYATRDSLRTNMKAGIYSLTIIDANSCRADSTIELTEPPALELAFDVKHAYCPDMPDGEIALTVIRRVSTRRTYLPLVERGNNPGSGWHPAGTPYRVSN